MSSMNYSAGGSGARHIFAKRLRELRVPRGFRTARSLAQAIGIDENRYTRYERAEVEPDLGLLMKICEVLGLTPNDLLMEGAIIGASGGDRSMGGLPPDARRVPIAPSDYLASAGFAEAAAPPPAMARDSPRSEDQAGPPASAGSLRRRAIAWQLARLACAHGIVVGGTVPTDAGDFGSVQRTSRVFASIERDPFAFVTAVAGSDRIATLPGPDQKRIALLIDDLITAVDATSDG